MFVLGLQKDNMQLPIWLTAKAHYLLRPSGCLTPLFNNNFPIYCKKHNDFHLHREDVIRYHNIKFEKVNVNIVS